MNEWSNKLLILFTCISFITGTTISYAGPSEFKVMCEEIPKDIGTGLAQSLTEIKLQELEKLITIRASSTGSGFAIESQLPFLNKQNISLMNFLVASEGFILEIQKRNFLSHY